MDEKCILCKKKSAIGMTTKLFCEDCHKKEGLVKLAAFQRDTRFKENYQNYQDECWKKEKVTKSNEELSKDLQKKCVSFSPEHSGFKEIVEEVKELNKKIPQLIKAKINLRKSTKEELKGLKEIIKENLKKIKETKLLESQTKGKKAKKKIQEEIKELKLVQEHLEFKKKSLKQELETLKKIE